MPFNRTRERDMGSRVVQLAYDLGLHNIDQRVEINKDVIYDNAPVGKYRPGVFKLSDVQLCRIRQHFADCDLSWYTTSTATTPNHHGKGQFFSGFQIEPSGSYIPVPSDDPLRTERLFKRSFLKITEDSLGLAETSAEFVEVLRMFADPVEGMARILRKCYYDSKSLKRTLSGASNAWLQYRYGWKPLYETAKSIAAGLPDYQGGIRNFSAHEQVQANVDPVRLLRRLRATVDTVAVLSAGSSTTTTDFVARHYVEVTDPSAFNAFKRGGSVFNVPSLAWNLVPFSFVVDWFFSFGDYIQALVPPLGASILKEATWSVKVQEDIANWLTATGYYSKPNPYRTTSTVQSTASRMTYRRLVVDPYSTSLPNWDFGFSNIQHVVDSLSLSFQKLKHLR